MKNNLLILSGAMILVNACAPKPGVIYPETVKDNTVDTYFGVEIPDPYRWLENDTSAATAAWVAAQNAVTNDYLQQIPFRQTLVRKLTELADYEKYGSPIKKNGRYYFFKNDGLQNQSVLYVQDTPEAEPRVLLDPNTLSEDGTVALNSITFSKEGKYLAYLISRSGSDWQEIFVLDLESGKLLPDHLRWVKFSGAEWQGDGFYYSAYDAPEAGKEFSNVNENHKIYYHTLGAPQSADRLVFENPEFPKRFYYAGISDDRNYLFIYESGAGRGNGLYMKALKSPGEPMQKIADNLDNEYGVVEVLGDRMLFITNDGAPKYRLMEARVSAPAFANWKELVPESDAVLSSAQLIGDKLILVYNQDAAARAYAYNLNGERLYEIELPAPGTVAFSGEKGDPEAFFVFTSFTFPASIYRYNVAENSSGLYRAPKVLFNPSDYRTEQVFYASKDGTQVPMFLTYKKGLERNGNNPVLLYGYGGFNVSLQPAFSTMRLPFLESGGIYVQANLRGGGEYGEEWHVAGTRMQKQNVFDDFIAAAEYLIRENYTRPEKIAIQGGSNGGLLVGAVMNQRPELFRVAIPQVGVMDMLRYHKFTIGWNWASDYGTSEESPEMFEYLRAYSPLHTLKAGTAYPATLVTTADHDDRVVPAHSFKYAAALQAANGGPNPTLIRIDSKAGHGAGKPIAKQIEEQADIYAFIMYHLGIKPAE
ncbi:MAG: prolyl oligopeptidase family serine peptidase [Culturomica sp.]|jgi:prolyl oligopeptidase|nr:prolyl oligopeptidase family serine peptidase [Culturomica sp.]